MRTAIANRAWRKKIIRARRRSRTAEVELGRIFGLRPDRILSAFPSVDGCALLVRFGDGRNFELSREDIKGFGRGRIADVDTDIDGTEIVIRSTSGAEILVPWDYVLYRCDPEYASLINAEDSGVGPREIGRRVRKLREKSKLTVAGLARLSGLARPNVHRLEAGRHRPQVETLAKVARALGVPLTAFLRS